MTQLHQYWLDHPEKIKSYFPSGEEESWIAKYTNSNIPHDEPWLTLVSCYLLFNDTDSKQSIKAFNELLDSCRIQGFKPIDSIKEVTVERKLPEISEYIKHLKKLSRKETFHYYPDKIQTIKDRNDSNKSLEGSTNLDLLIKAKRGDQDIVFFIEAKFISDIDSKITYNPVRDQISRNIDAGIDCCNANKIPLEDFHFLMLTPKTFRTETYKGNRSDQSNTFRPDRSRLYCYKMDDYKKPERLKEVLL